MGRPRRPIDPHTIKEVAIRVVVGKTFRSIEEALELSRYMLHRIMRLPEFGSLCALMKAEVAKQLRQVRL